MKGGGWIPIVVGLTTVSVLGVAVAQMIPEEETQPDEEWSPTVEEHVVEQGDTLWDLCEEVLGRPELWPKVWALNPEITNPHWIYPGDIVRFYESMQPLPALYALLPDGAEEPRSGSGRETTDLLRDSGAALKSPPVEVVKRAPRARRKGPKIWQAYVGMYLTRRELKEAGKLTNAAPDRYLLATGDTVYLKFPKGRVPRIGAKMMAYRTLREVDHPVTGRFWGHVTQVTGIVEVQSFRDGVAYGEVIEAIAEMERGQLVTPLVQHPLQMVTSKKTEKDMRGVVVSVHQDERSFAADGSYVFIDKGKTDGVLRGNRFRVIRPGDPIAERRDNSGVMEVGTLLVVDTKDRASTCLVLNTIREIEAGDVIQAL